MKIGDTERYCGFESYRQRHVPLVCGFNSDEIESEPSKCRKGEGTCGVMALVSAPYPGIAQLVALLIWVQEVGRSSRPARTSGAVTPHSRTQRIAYGAEIAMVNRMVLIVGYGPLRPILYQR